MAHSSNEVVEKLSAALRNYHRILPTHREEPASKVNAIKLSENFPALRTSLDMSDHKKKSDTLRLVQPTVEIEKWERISW